MRRLSDIAPRPDRGRGGPERASWSPSDRVAGGRIDTQRSLWRRRRGLALRLCDAVRCPLAVVIRQPRSHLAVDRRPAAGATGRRTGFAVGWHLAPFLGFDSWRTAPRRARVGGAPEPAR